MYLSRLMLNHRSRQVRRDIANCQDLHRTLLRAFSEHNGTGEMRKSNQVLYRLDTKSELFRVYVQSKAKPNWSSISFDYFTEPPACKSITEQYSLLTSGVMLRFLLRANPTRKTGTIPKSIRQDGEDQYNGRRTFISHTTAQCEWLERKAQNGGFQLLNVVTNNPHTVYGRRRASNGESQELKLGGIDFQGVLCIVDSAIFLHTLQVGIGSGKAYGFGLLSLAPAQP